MIGMGAFADFVLALYPILIIGRLQQMKLSMKIGLCVVMGGGVVYITLYQENECHEC